VVWARPLLLVLLLTVSSNVTLLCGALLQVFFCVLQTLVTKLRASSAMPVEPGIFMSW